MIPAESPNPAASDRVLPGAVRTPWNLFIVRLRRKKLAMIGACVLVALYTLSIFAGFFAPYRYDRIDKERPFHPPTRVGWNEGLPAVYRYQKAAGSSKYTRTPEPPVPLRFFVQGDPYRLLGWIPTTIHLFGVKDPDVPIYWLGSDQFGRDILSRVLYGSQISLSIGLIGIVLSLGLGMLVGGFSGFLGGMTDSITMRVCELIMSIPGLYLIMALRSVFPPSLSSTSVYLLIVVILSFIRWAGAARVIRGMALSLRERQYVLAAQALGQTNLSIVVRHILPGTFSYIIVAATLSVPYYILGEVVMSYLNVGIQEPEASWGLMLNAAQNSQYLQDYPWLLAPGGAIFITVLAFNFLGDGLRDAADTKSN